MIYYIELLIQSQTFHCFLSLLQYNKKVVFLFNLGDKI